MVHSYGAAGHSALVHQLCRRGRRYLLLDGAGGCIVRWRTPLTAFPTVRLRCGSIAATAAAASTAGVEAEKGIRGGERIQRAANVSAGFVCFGGGGDSACHGHGYDRGLLLRVPPLSSSSSVLLRALLPRLVPTTRMASTTTTKLSSLSSSSLSFRKLSVSSSSALPSATTKVRLMLDGSMIELRVMSRTGETSDGSDHNRRDDDDDDSESDNDEINIGKSNDDSMTTSHFHAGWLWIQDPQHTHAASGQRTQFALDYFAAGSPTIQTARIVPAIEIVDKLLLDEQQQQLPNVADDDVSDAGSMWDRLPIPPPPRAFLHPFGSKQDALSIISNRDIQNTKDVLRDMLGKRSWLHVVWNNNSNNNINNNSNNVAPQEESYFDVDWLWQNRYTPYPNVQEQQDDAAAVTPAVAINHDTTLPSFDYYTAVQDDQTRFQVLQAVVDHGAALILDAPSPYAAGNSVDDVPPVAQMVQILAGALSHGTLYGSIFHVRPTAWGRSIAYTGLPIGPHQDLAYYESPPGLQSLHCVGDNQNVIGGQSLLVDALAAAHAFRDIAPDLFDLLTTWDATFIKQRGGDLQMQQQQQEEGGTDSNNYASSNSNRGAAAAADMVYRRPHIQLSGDGRHVVSVRWGPPFQGPPTMPSNKDPNHHYINMMDYLLAHAAFTRLVDYRPPLRDHHDKRQVRKEDAKTQRFLSKFLSPSTEQKLVDYAQHATWEQHLETGQMLLLNNLRMLHGRRAFTIEAPMVPLPLPTITTTTTTPVWSPGRHLMGCYGNLDDALSTYRVLRRQFLLDPQQQQHGNNINHNEFGTEDFIRNPGHRSSRTV